jgi:hypothetical protein
MLIASGEWRNQNCTMTAHLWLVSFENLNLNPPLTDSFRNYTPGAARDCGRQLVYWFA